MAKKMLIDATHPEETRVVVVDGSKVEEFDFESENKRQLAGNIYLAKVTRVEPSLQAAFVDYGGNRHGFLAFSEIHPDYYQIPVADREALMAEERAYARSLEEDDNDSPKSSSRRRNDRRGKSKSEPKGAPKADPAEVAAAPEASESEPPVEQAQVETRVEAQVESQVETQPEPAPMGGIPGMDVVDLTPEDASDPVMDLVDEGNMGDPRLTDRPAEPAEATPAEVPVVETPEAEPVAEAPVWAEKAETPEAETVQEAAVEDTVESVAEEAEAPTETTEITEAEHATDEAAPEEVSDEAEAAPETPADEAPESDSSEPETEGEDDSDTPKIMLASGPSDIVTSKDPSEVEAEAEAESAEEAPSADASNEAETAEAAPEIEAEAEAPVAETPEAAAEETSVEAPVEVAAESTAEDAPVAEAEAATDAEPVEAEATAEVEAEAEAEAETQEAETSEDAVEAEADEDTETTDTDGSDADSDASDEDDADEDEDSSKSDFSARDDEIEDVADDDIEAEVRRPRKPRPRRYKIQEVIKVRQILLVQVVKEERGNKGAALTTYLSLAGRYCVLMPNTARGGGISRKITNAADRKKLKQIATELDVPEGAGLIVRTAGAKRTKSEIKRDYEYLQRMWEQIRELTLKSVAPAKIYEEGDLIKRSIRDLYSREIEEVLVEGEAGYRNAKDFMKMIMPSHAKNVQQYTDPLPLFARHQVDSYLDGMFNPTVKLKSGGYIVIGVTEALVAIDVNSGKATKEGSIEQTALNTNLEAADEISRQLRLRDLAGLIVIDFIDMEERKNNAAVEKRFKDKLKSDRARIQVGRISGFGLMEMSRQRLRPGMIEASTQPCPACHGTGLIRSEDSLGLSILRQIEEEGVRRRSREVLVKVPVQICNYLMNQKRAHIANIEQRYGLSVRIEADPHLVSPDFTMERFRTASRVIEATTPVVSVDMTDFSEPEPEAEIEAEIVEAEEAEADPSNEDEQEQPKKRRRRRRRRGSDADGQESSSDAKSDGEGEESGEAESSDESSAKSGNGETRRRRRRGGRGRRGGGNGGDRQATREDADGETATAADADAPEDESAVEAVEATATEASPEPAEATAPEASEQTDENAPAETPAEEAVSSEAPPSEVDSAVEEAPISAEAAEAAEADQPSVEAPATSEEIAEPEAAAEETSEIAAEAVVEAEPKSEESSEPEVAEAESTEDAPTEDSAPEEEPVLETVADAPAEPPKPKRRGWWSMGS
ncbi:MAG: Rne/Rng family ribonuclease [Mangrovicoccus sp.]